MSRLVYPKPKAGEWVQPSRKGYRMRCCDCGLVHLLQFRLVPYANGTRRKIRFRVYRDEAETRRGRRANNITVKVRYKQKGRR